MTANVYSHRRTLMIVAAAVVIVFVLWNVPQLDMLLYPFRLFVTYVHEAGHGLMALLTGGQFLRFEIYSNGAGQALTAGGSRALILPAGYLGAALFGAVLFYLVNRLHYSRSIAFVLGLLLILMTILFGRFSATAFWVGILFGAVLLALAYKAGREINAVVLNVLAILTGLNAVLDVYFLVGNSGA
ncbi:MAG TPA: M50 family metallopeptidase, partial [Phototrophicaceae bacterium]|nr:M50 family metallopeptidase [Phototrophicaceae bacterium]